MPPLQPPGALPAIRHDVRSNARHFTPGPPPPRPIGWIVLHSTQGPPGGSSLAWLTTDPASLDAQGWGPSAHTLTARDGTLWELVAPADVAHHVGYARPGFSNARALGIEIENSSSPALGRHEAYPAAQLNAAAYRVATWQFSYGIPATGIVLHREIAVWPPGHPQAGQLGRRSDPDGLDVPAFLAQVAAWLHFLKSLPPDQHPHFIF